MCAAIIEIATNWDFFFSQYLTPYEMLSRNLYVLVNYLRNLPYRATCLPEWSGDI